MVNVPCVFIISLPSTLQSILASVLPCEPGTGESSLMEKAGTRTSRSLRVCANLAFQLKSLPSVTEVLYTRDTSRHHSKGAEMGTAHPGPRRWLFLPLPSTKLSLEIVCPSPVIHERDVRVGARSCRREIPGWDRTCGPAPKKRPPGSHTSRVAWPEDVAPRHLPLRDVSEVGSG